MFRHKRLLIYSMYLDFSKVYNKGNTTYVLPLSMAEESSQAFPCSYISLYH